MADAVAETAETLAGKSKLPLIAGLVLALAGAGGGYFAVTGGYVPLGHSGVEHDGKDAEHAETEHEVKTGFVPIDPIMVSMGKNGDRHLRFRAQLEVKASAQHDVQQLLPRVVDVLNGYLRALDLQDLSDPAALTRLRGQMLRRVQVVAGRDRIRDLLVMEFVLN